MRRFWRALLQRPGRESPAGRAALACPKSEERLIIQYLESLLGVLSPSIIDVGGNKEAEIATPFASRGWRTLIIEPQGVCVRQLQAKFSHLPNVQIAQAGCSDSQGALRLYHGKDGDGSEVATLSDRSDPWFDEVRSTSHETIHVRLLTDIAAEAGMNPPIGILKIDTESWDYRVLKGFDLERFQPQVIVTEEYLWASDESMAKYELLDAHGYTNVGFAGYNSVWVHRGLGASPAMLRLSPWLLRIGRRPPGLGSPELLEQIPIWDRIAS